MKRRAALLGTTTGVWFEPKEQSMGAAVQRLINDPRRATMKVGDKLSLQDAPASK